MLKEFKEFAIKGNMVDLAIGVVLGAAFSAVVNSIVGDVFTPVLALLTGSLDFRNLTFILREAVGDEPALELRYGLLIQVTLNFLIVALSLFFVVKGMNRLRRKGEPKQVEALPPPRQEVLLEEIRDLLKTRQ